MGEKVLKAVQRCLLLIHDHSLERLQIEQRNRELKLVKKMEKCEKVFKREEE
jgi:hypothetical protein